MFENFQHPLLRSAIRPVYNFVDGKISSNLKFYDFLGSVPTLSSHLPMFVKQIIVENLSQQVLKGISSPKNRTVTLLAASRGY
jgi:hypothetical protein